MPLVLASTNDEGDENANRAPHAKHVQLLTACGLALLALGPAFLLATGNTAIRMSADDTIPPVSLWSALIAPLASSLLAWRIPPHCAPRGHLSAIPRPRLARELMVLVAMAVAFPVAVGITEAAGMERGLEYPALKLALFLVVPLVAFRLIRTNTNANAPAARTMPLRIPYRQWLAPLTVVVAWFCLYKLSPWAPPRIHAYDLPDPATLAVTSIETMVTASILEEVFYRGFLQTRAEKLYGRWFAIALASLLFAAMHIPRRVHADAIGLGLATVLSFQGIFAIFQGYVWSRYRNIWVTALVHVMMNLVYVDVTLDSLDKLVRAL